MLSLLILIFFFPSLGSCWPVLMKTILNFLTFRSLIHFEFIFVYGVREQFEVLKFFIPLNESFSLVSFFFSF